MTSLLHDDFHPSEVSPHMIHTADPRDNDLAKLLIEYSVAAKKGDLVIVHCIGQETLGLGAACVQAALRAGAAPYLELRDPALWAKFQTMADASAIERYAEFDLLKMQNATCYLGIRGSGNIFEEASVPRAQKDLMAQRYYTPVHLEERVKRTRWCVMRYPNPSMAQLAQKSTPDFADFYYSVCCVDYPAMARAVEPLKKVMEAADKVRIVGPGETNLTFSIKDIPVIPCCGLRNIPDGECFTAPVRNSINGVVQFNTPTSEGGVGYENIRLEFKDGKVVDVRGANATQTRQLNEVLDRDEGSRYVGEFSLGFNPAVLEPMRDILFDEKISGSFHMALGQAYEEADNGNRSAQHWDLVCIQRSDYGGGEIWFDDRLIRKDGIFVIPELEGLNPSVLGAK